MSFDLFFLLHPVGTTWKLPTSTSASLFALSRAKHSPIASTMASSSKLGSHVDYVTKVDNAFEKAKKIIPDFEAICNDLRMLKEQSLAASKGMTEKVATSVDAAYLKSCNDAFQMRITKWDSLFSQLETDSIASDSEAEPSDSDSGSSGSSSDHLEGRYIGQLFPGAEKAFDPNKSREKKTRLGHPDDPLLKDSFTAQASYILAIEAFELLKVHTAAVKQSSDSKGLKKENTAKMVKTVFLAGTKFLFDNFCTHPAVKSSKSEGKLPGEAKEYERDEIAKFHGLPFLDLGVPESDTGATSRSPVLLLTKGQSKFASACHDLAALGITFTVERKEREERNLPKDLLEKKRQASKSPEKETGEGSTRKKKKA